MEIGLNPKILIVTPTANHKDYCLDDWSKSISELTYDNLDMLIVDNSSDKNHLQEFKKYKFRPKTFITHLERTEEDKDIRVLMLRCNELTRKFAIKNNYEYIISIESDVFAPCKNAIEILLENKKDVVGFDYFIGQYHNSMPIVFNRVSTSTYFTNDVQGNWMSGLLLHDGKLKEVPNLGLGFLLISKAVFRKIPFRVDDEEWHISSENFSHADTFFHIDLAKNGIPIYCDTRYLCEHRNQSWKKILEIEQNDK